MYTDCYLYYIVHHIVPIPHLQLVVSSRRWQIPAHRMVTNVVYRLKSDARRLQLHTLLYRAFRIRPHYTTLVRTSQLHVRHNVCTSKIVHTCNNTEPYHVPAAPTSCLRQKKRTASKSKERIFMGYDTKKVWRTSGEPGRWGFGSGAPDDIGKRASVGWSSPERQSQSHLCQKNNTNGRV